MRVPETAPPPATESTEHPTGICSSTKYKADPAKGSLANCTAKTKPGEYSAGNVRVALGWASSKGRISVVPEVVTGLESNRANPEKEAAPEAPRERSPSN